jgi:ribosomal protein S18 acetylase RimI-like enzyme
MVASLLAWGAEQGASRVYLQVRDDNVIAHGLYRSLNLERVYGYTHRVMSGP